MGQSKVVRRLVTYVNRWFLGQLLAILILSAYYTYRLLRSAGYDAAAQQYRGDVDYDELRGNLYEAMAEHGVPYARLLRDFLFYFFTVFVCFGMVFLHGAVSLLFKACLSEVWAKRWAMA